MERGEIWWVRENDAEGREIKGDRRCVILTTAKWHARGFLPIVAMITSRGQHARDHGFAIPLHGLKLDTVGEVRCDTVRALDVLSPAREGRRIEGDLIGEFVMDEILETVQSLFDVEED